MAKVPEPTLTLPTTKTTPPKADPDVPDVPDVQVMDESAKPDNTSKRMDAIEKRVRSMPSSSSTYAQNTGPTAKEKNETMLNDAKASVRALLDDPKALAKAVKGEPVKDDEEEKPDVQVTDEEDDEDNKKDAKGDEDDDEKDSKNKLDPKTLKALHDKEREARRLRVEMKSIAKSNKSREWKENQYRKVAKQYPLLILEQFGATEADLMSDLVEKRSATNKDKIKFEPDEKELDKDITEDSEKAKWRERAEAAERKLAEKESKEAVKESISYIAKEIITDEFPHCQKMGEDAATTIYIETKKWIEEKKKETEAKGKKWKDLDEDQSVELTEYIAGKVEEEYAAVAKKLVGDEPRRKTKGGYVKKEGNGVDPQVANLSSRDIINSLRPR